MVIQLRHVPPVLLEPSLQRQRLRVKYVWQAPMTTMLIRAQAVSSAPREPTRSGSCLLAPIATLGKLTKMQTQALHVKSARMALSLQLRQQLASCARLGYLMETAMLQQCVKRALEVSTTLSAAAWVVATTVPPVSMEAIMPALLPTTVKLVHQGNLLRADLQAVLLVRPVLLTRTATQLLRVQFVQTGLLRDVQV